MLHATPRGIFSWGFTFRQGGKALAEIDPVWIGEAAEVAIAGQPFTLARESLLEGKFVMRRGREVIARACKPSAFARAFEVELAGRRFELRAASAWGRGFGLSVEGVEVGRITPAGWWTRKAVIDLPGEIPAPAQVVLFWLV